MLISADPQLRQKSDEPGGRTDEIVAKASGFGSKDTLRKALYIADSADEITIKRLDDGKIKINAAYNKLRGCRKERPMASQECNENLIDIPITDSGGVEADIHDDQAMESTIERPLPQSQLVVNENDITCLCEYLISIVMEKQELIESTARSTALSEEEAESITQCYKGLSLAANKLSKLVEPQNNSVSLETKLTA